MKKLILATALLFASTGALAEGTILDPWDYPAINITCQYPIEREDNTILLRTDISSVEFYVSGPNSLLPIAWGGFHSINTTSCSTTINISGYSDGQYYVTATTTDTDGRVSAFSIDETVSAGAYAFEVQAYTKPPKSPTGMIGIPVAR